jgi:mRNA interferase MazF
MIVKKPSRGEIWLVDLNPTVGREQAKKRPCLVLSADSLNHGYAGLCIVVPLTSKDKKNPLHIPILPNEGGVMVKSFILSEQIRAVSHERFSNYLGFVEEKTLLKVEFTLKALLAFK